MDTYSFFSLKKIYIELFFSSKVCFNMFHFLFFLKLSLFNPFTPMNDQDRISPYNINTISTREVMRIKENINLEVIS